LHEWIVVTASLLFLNAVIMVFNRVRLYDLQKCFERKRESEDIFRVAFLISPDSVNITRLSDSCYIEVNDGFVKALGWSREDAVGKTSLELNIWRNSQDRQRLVAALQRDVHCAELEAEYVSKDGGVMTGLISANIMRIQGEYCMLSVTRDITERKAAQGQITSLAFYDPLTELPNRRLLNDRLKQAIAYSARNARYGALLFLVTGAEALLRWKHPRRGLVSPLEFIPLAEDNGLIIPIGAWVIETACAQLSAWSKRPEMCELRIAVNVSASQFSQADFVEKTLAILEQTGANPALLKMELSNGLAG
jgi:PAS domain S-box-containing protein